ncbi:MAG TPA: acetate--CoA ligase [Candidatus Paceibacterota bacterium]|nr:acetate--CoA ligase [Candidatus Paceibacterota bacterium]
MTNQQERQKMREERTYYPAKELSDRAHIKNMEEYRRMYKESVEDPQAFWGKQAEKHLSWFKKWDSVLEYDFAKIGEVQGPYVQFFRGAKLNVSYNCLDRHVNSWRKNKAAIIWQGEKEEDKRTITYQQLQRAVSRFANVLVKHGVQKGDTVTIFMPMVPEAAVAMLACTRIGAIHSVVFSAFSAEALKNRILDCDSKFVLTCDIGFHGGKVIELKEKVDEALQSCPDVKKVLVYKRGEKDAVMQKGRDLLWQEEVNAEDIQDTFTPAEMDAEDPLFILYTSGSTGKPKGVLHTTGGYLLYATLTCKYVFDLKDEDVYWCSADIGWVTGHSYVVYGPLANGATVVMFEGTPTYPEPDRFWKIIEEYGVTIFYTAPTAIRALMRLGEEWPGKHDLSSLRILGSVGEPINPEAWMWYYRVIGKECCPIVDTWWQTETGGIMITPLPGATPLKPGSASFPFFGIVPEVLKDDGLEAPVNEGGRLVITKPWPGMIRGVYGDPKNELVKKVYFSLYPGKYFTGDGSRKDESGFYWLLGRVDDVMNISGHRFSTAEIESALVGHESVAEAAVVGVPHDIKGEGMHCFVTLKQGYESSPQLIEALIMQVRKEIGPIATPDRIQFAEQLPKTRSGKIMRRILRKIAIGDTQDIGDTSTLADPSVVETLVANKV